MSNSGLGVERWRRLVNIIEVVLELEPSLRLVYLNSIGQDDRGLEQEARNLLAHLGITSSDEEQTEPGSTGETKAERIGAYRVLELLGQGGMGAVFLAEQKEEGLARKVAIKVLHDRYGVNLARERFLAERQILAHLEHPNIARMLDAGTTADGRPYLVIDAIDGEPIDDYLDRRNLGLEQRIEVFRKVCRAVSYAHRNLVVHRDLKPSNILVTAGGEPKLLDFGIAKILSRDVFEAIDRDLTRSSERPMTPSYASPEQVRGLPITTATDIFALGTLLYKLLTGELPYRYPARTPEVMQVVQDSGLMPPSAVLRERGDAESADLARSVQGDLDNIILTALGKREDVRYASVDELEGDLRRFVEGEPVRATRGRWTYRTAKFVRRHRWPAALAALLILSIIVGLTVAGSQAREILEEKARAESERDRAEEISDFLIGLFIGAGPTEDLRRKATVQSLIDNASKRLEEGLETSPTTRAELFYVIANTYMTLGMSQRARELYEESLRLREELGLETDLREITTLRRLAWTLTEGDQQDIERAEQWFEEAQAWTAEHGETEEQVFALSGLARIAERRQELDQALEFMLEARRLVDGAPEVSEEVRASVHTTLGSHFLTSNRVEEALPHLERSVDIKSQSYDEDSPELSVALNNLAGAYAALGRFDDAARTLERAVDIHRRFFGAETVKAALFLVNLGLFEARAGRSDRGLSLLAEAIAMLERAQGAESFDIAWAEQSRGTVLLHVNDLEGARASFNRSLSLYRRLDGDESPSLRLPLTTLAHVELAEGRAERAVELAENSLALSAKAPDARSAELREADAWLVSAAALAALGDEDEAANQFRRAEEVARAEAHVISVKRQLESIRAVALLRLGDAEAAEPLLEGLARAGHRDARFRLLCGPRRTPSCGRVRELMPPEAGADAPAQAASGSSTSRSSASSS